VLKPVDALLVTVNSSVLFVNEHDPYMSTCNIYKANVYPTKVRNIIAENINVTYTIFCTVINKWPKPLLNCKKKNIERVPNTAFMA
jgi:hypothetical protein